MEEFQSDIEEGDLDADNSWNRSYKNYEESYEQKERDKTPVARKKTKYQQHYKNLVAVCMGNTWSENNTTAIVIN